MTNMAETSAPERDTGEPQRVQLRRTKGWRMPPNTVSVAHGPWLALFRALEWQAGLDRGVAVCDLRELLREANLDRPLSAEADLAPLRGKNLACWCKPGQPCHADVLLELANATRNTQDEKGLEG